LKDHSTLEPASRDKASSSMVVLSSPRLSAVTSEPGIVALILSLRRDSPNAVDAIRQLYELTRSIVEPYVGSNPNAPRLEDQVEELITITLEIIFSGGLAEQSTLPQFVETLARHWNRVPMKAPMYGPGAASGLKRGSHIRFPLARVK